MPPVEPEPRSSTDRVAGQGGRPCRETTLRWCQLEAAGPDAGPTQAPLPGTTSKLAPKGLRRKKQNSPMSSAEVRQDPAGSLKEKGPAGHIGKKVSGAGKMTAT